MTLEEAPIHILLVSFPAQVHINPLLRLGKCLAAKGARIIFTTTQKAGKNMRTVNSITEKLATPIGDGSLIFEFFDHSLLDDGSIDHTELELVGRQFVSQMIKNHSDSGVPVLAFPSFGDQPTNAKFLIDVFGVGIRLGYSLMENKLVTRDEVKKCLLEATTGEQAERLKQNAIKWKNVAEDAVAFGGSSDRHLDAFIQDIKKHGIVNIQKM